jgi:regulatory protein
MMRAGHGLDVCLKILRAVDQGGYPDEENVSPDID